MWSDQVRGAGGGVTTCHVAMLLPGGHDFAPDVVSMLTFQASSSSLPVCPTVLHELL